MRLLLFVLVGVMCLLLFDLINIARPEWPNITNADLLRTESAAIIGNEEFSRIPQTKWPESIKDLNPMYVYAGTNYVRVIISGGGIDAGYGILIYPDGRGEAEKQTGRRVLEKISDGIFRYENIE